MNSAETTDVSILLSSCMTGDQQAIESLVCIYETGVFKLALSVVDDPAEASEITQETFITALKSLRSYRERSSFKAWLYTIALNISRSHLRKQKSLQRLRSTLTTLFRLEEQKTALPEENTIQNENERQLWRVLSELDEKHRLPLVLRYFHDMPIAEIAELLALNEGTVHSRLHVGRERLRAELKKFAGD